MTRSNRHKWFILGSFQKWFVASFLVYTTIFLAIFGLGLVYWFKLMSIELMKSAGVRPEMTYDAIQKAFENGAWIAVLITSIMLLLAGLQALILSRRIAGPAFALARHIDECAEEGKIKSFTLRKDDVMKELATKFNETVEKLQSN